MVSLVVSGVAWLARVAVGASMFLGATDGPDAGRNGLDTRQQTGHPVFFYFRGVAVTGDCRAIDRHGHVADAEQDTAALQLVDADIHFADAGNGEISGHWFPEWVTGGRRFCFWVIDLEYFAEFVFCPDTIFEGKWDAFVAEDDDDVILFLGGAGGGICQQEDPGPGEGKELIGAGYIEYKAVFALELAEPGIGIGGADGGCRGCRGKFEWYVEDGEGGGARGYLPQESAPG